MEGLDNLFVPLGVSALYAVLFLPAAAYTPALAGLLLSGAVALASFRLRLLTVAGGLGAVAVGTLAFAIGGWPLWLLLMWFFGNSNVASKLMARSAVKRNGGATEMCIRDRIHVQLVGQGAHVLLELLALELFAVAAGDGCAQEA